MLKTKNYTRHFSIKLEKPYFGPNLGPFGPKSPRQDIFSPKYLALLKLNILTSCKNHKGAQTRNEQRDRGYFIGPSLGGKKNFKLKK